MAITVGSTTGKPKAIGILALMMLAAVGAQAQQTDGQLFRVVLTTLDARSPADIAAADSLLDLVEASVAEVSGLQPVRMDGPFADIAEAESNTRAIHGDADALAVISFRRGDSTTYVGVEYVSISPPGGTLHPDSTFRDRTWMTFRNWPPSPGSDTLAIVLPILAGFVEGSTYGQRGMSQRSMEYVESVIAMLQNTELPRLEATYRFVLARNLFTVDGNIPAAIYAMDAALELYPEMSEGYRYRALMKEAQGDLQGAYDDLSLAISRDSTNALAWRERGAIAMRAGEDYAAAVDLSRAIELGETASAVYNGRGMALTNLGYSEEALEDFHAAIEADPRNTDPYMNAAVLYTNLGDRDAAIELLEQALEHAPESHLMAVTLQMMRQDWQQTTLAASEAIASGSDDPFFYMWRGVAYLELSEYQLALDDFLQVRDYFAAGNYGSVQSPQDQNIQGIIEGLRSFLDHPEGSAEYLVARAQYHISQERYEDAVDDFTAALAMPGTSPELYYQCAMCRERAGDIHQAAEDLQRFLDSGAGNDQQRRMARQMLERLRR